MKSYRLNPAKNRYTVPLYNTELLVTVAVIGMIPFLIAIVFMYFVVFIVIACKERIRSLFGATQTDQKFKKRD